VAEQYRTLSIGLLGKLLRRDGAPHLRKKNEGGHSDPAWSKKSEGKNEKGVINR